MNRFCLVLLLFLPGLSTALQAEPINVPLSVPQQQTPAMQSDQPDSNDKTELLDIKGPIEITDNSKTVIFTAAAIAGLILLIALSILWWKRSRKQQAILAHETALQKLLRAQQLIDKHKVDAFVTLIDQTLRNYIEQRFAISARRQTTHEFIAGITEGKKSVNKPLARNKKSLQIWLEHCDLVKFARADLNTDTMAEMLANLRSFIESTRMEPEK